MAPAAMATPEIIQFGYVSIELWILQIIVSITALTTAVVTSAMVSILLLLLLLLLQSYKHYLL